MYNGKADARLADGPPYINNGHGATGTKTTMRAATGESHFFPLFRRRQNNTISQDKAEAGREKALPKPPGESVCVLDNDMMLMVPAPVTTTSDTPSSDVTPTLPMPIVVPATPRPKHKAIHDIRRVRSSGTLRQTQPDEPRRSEQTDRATPFSPRGRQTAISSPSLHPARTLSPPNGLAPAPAGFGPGPMILGDGSWEREQGRLTWESQHEFGHLGPQPFVSHSLGSRDQQRERERRPSAPSLSLPAARNSKGKGKAVQPTPDPKDPAGKRSLLGRRPSFWSRKGKSKGPEVGVSPRSGQPTTLAPDLFSSNSNAAMKRSLEVPKSGLGRSTASFDESLSPRLSATSPRPSASSWSSLRKINSRKSTDSALHRLNNTSRQNLSNPRQSIDSPRLSIESRPSMDLMLPNVRPTSPLFSEFGVYRPSVDFAPAASGSNFATTNEKGGPAERPNGIEIGTGRSVESIPEHGDGNVDAVAGTQTPPPRRRLTNNSVGRAASWRRSLVESARNLIGASSISIEGADGVPVTAVFGDHVLSGSPVRTASSSPVPWTSTATSPRASPAPRSGQGSGSRAGRGSPVAVPGVTIPALGPSSPDPGLAIRTGSLRSRHGSPVPITSPTTATRVTFGDEPRRPRTGSITAGFASITNWRAGSIEGGDGTGIGGRTVRRARSTSRLTAALSPSRSRSFSLFGPRPASAGQAQTRAQASREQGSSPGLPISALGHSHPSAFGPATDPGLSLSLSPSTLGATGVGYMITSASPIQPEPPAPGTPLTGLTTPLTGSQLSLSGGPWSATGYGGSSAGHGGSTSWTQLGSSTTNVSTTTTTAGVSRASSILLRSPLRPRSNTNPPLLRRLSGVFGSGGAGRNGSEILSEMGMSPIAKPAPASKTLVVTRTDDDTPETFLARLLESVGKSEITNAIASKYVPIVLLE